MDEEKVTLWKQRMTSFRSSGLSIKKWCRENHIAPPTFYYWRSRLENEIVTTNQPTFVEVKQIEKTIFFLKKYTEIQGQIALCDREV